MSGVDSNEQLTHASAAAAMFSEVVGLPVEGAKVTNTFIDDRDLGIEFDLPVPTFQGQNVGRVTVAMVFEQTNFYTHAPHNLEQPAVVTVAIPNGRNFGEKNRPAGSFEIDHTGRRGITAVLPAFAGQGQGEALVSRDPEQVSAVVELAKRLVAASGIKDPLR